MSPNRWAQTREEFAWRTRTTHARQRMSNAHKKQPMRAVHNTHGWINLHKPRPMRAMHDQFHIDNAAFCWPRFVSQSLKALDDGVCCCTTPMSPKRYAHAKTHSCKPWLMVLVVTQNNFVEANMPRLMHGPVGAFNCLARILTYLSRHHFF